MQPRARLSVFALLLSACAAPAPISTPPAPLPPPSCAAPLRAALAEIASLRGQGRLDRALRAAALAVPLCPELTSDVNETRLDLLVEIGDDEAALELARDVAANEGTSASLAGKARGVLARPARAKTRADLRSADDLRAKGDLAGAYGAYREALAAHPRDPVALAALGDVEMARSQPAAARSLFDRALRAAGSPARIVTFEPASLHGPLTKGMLRPDGAKVGVLRRAAASGDGFPTTITGPEIAMGPTLVALFGPGRPLVVASRDGNNARSIPLHDVTEAVFLPGEKELVALAKGEVHRVDVATAAVLAHATGGKGLRFAGATRLVAGAQVLRFPELTPVYSLPEGARVSPRVVAYVEPRDAPKGQRTWLVVKRTEDGAPIFERNLGGVDFDPVIEVHPSGRFVGWLGEVFAQKVNTGEILDVETRTITTFPYLGMNKVQISALRIAADGKATCAFDLGWTPSRSERGKDTHCWVRDGQAVIVSVPPTPRFKAVTVLGSQGSLSPDGKLASFAELGERKDGLARFAVRVVDVATGRDVKRFELGTTDRYDSDAVMVTSSVVRVESGEPFDGHYDARTGALVPPPPDAREPDLGVLPVSEEKLLKHDEPHVLVRLGLLELKSDTGSSCWTASTFRPAPVDRCLTSPPGDVVVKAGAAQVPGTAAPVRLSIPVTGTRGSVIKLGKVDVLVIPDAWMARYFSMKGALIGTIVALAPRRFAGLLPDGTFDLLGDSDGGHEHLACLAGDLVFSFEVCADLRLAPHALLDRLGAP